MNRRPLLITGGRGTLARAFAQLCTVRDLAHVVTTREQLDIADHDSISRCLDTYRPWAVINAAGYVRVDDAEHDQALCLRENAHAAAMLAAGCASAGIPLVTFSSDLVFDGEKGAPYCEDDRPRPLSVYGRSKAEAEVRVLDAHPRALVVRTSAFFGPWDVHNFVTITLAELTAGRSVRAAHDASVSPTYLPDLVNSCLDLLIDGEVGIWHLSNRGEMTWAELARAAATCAGVDHGGLDAVPAAAMPWRARRPRNCALDTARGAYLPPLEDALARYVQETSAVRSLLVTHPERTPAEAHDPEPHLIPLVIDADRGRILGGAA